MSATDGPDGTIRVEVVYALPNASHSRVMHLPPGSSAGDAIGVFLREVGEAGDHDGIGIFGRRCEPSTPLRDGDRVELYRPLIADAKQVRRERARRNKL